MDRLPVRSRFLDAELFHATVQRLAAQAEVARRACDHAAGARERLLDLAPVRLALRLRTQAMMGPLRAAVRKEGA